MRFPDEPLLKTVFFLSFYIIASILFAAPKKYQVPSQLPSIQAAVDASTNGDTIVIDPGTYFESVNVQDKQLYFIGSFSDNKTTIDGNRQQGFYNVNSGALIRNISFRNCSEGIRCIGSPEAYIDIVDCQFYNNSVGLQSTGWIADRVLNCLFFNNVTGYSHVYLGSDSYVSNCTFVNNITDVNFAPGYSTNAKLNVFNSILLDRVAGTEDNYVFLHFSNYSGDLLGDNVEIMEGCIQTDPQFVDTAAHNFKLLPTSNSINTGHPNSLYNDFDGSRNDMGFTGGKFILLNRVEFNFGYTGLNRTRDLNLSIINYNNVSILIDNMELTDHQLSTNVYLPVIVLPGAEKKLIFTVQPTAAGQFSSNIKISYNINSNVYTSIFPAVFNGISYSGGTIKVPDQCPTIQAAVEAALTGETILLDPKLYLERIFLYNKNIKIVGNGSVKNVVLDGIGGNAIRAISSNLKLENTTILNSENGIYASNHSNVNVYNSIFVLNNSAITASARTSVNIYNCLLHHNTIGLQEVYYADYDSYINNSTFANNVDDIIFTPGYESMVNMFITNSILRGKITSHTDNGPVYLNYCNYDSSKIGTNVVLQAGNQTFNPRFVNTMLGDYNLHESSPCIDAGTPDTSGLHITSHDLENYGRIWNGRIDLGAYEYGSQEVPVELIRFSANINDNLITLNWTTATEVNNYGFDIEKSTSQIIRWEKVGFVAGSGTSSEVHTYSFTDSFSDKGIYLYRLKQIDYSGIVFYTSPITVSYVKNPDKFALLQNYPNPFNASTVISFQLASKTTVQLLIFDILGKQIKTVISEEIAAGKYDIEFNADDLPTGIYFYQLQAGSFVDTKKLLLLK